MPSVITGPEGTGIGGNAGTGADALNNTGFVYNVPRAYVDQNLLNTGTSSAFDTRSDVAQL